MTSVVVIAQLQAVVVERSEAQRVCLTQELLGFAGGAQPTACIVASIEARASESKSRKLISPRIPLRSITGYKIPRGGRWINLGLFCAKQRNNLLPTVTFLFDFLSNETIFTIFYRTFCK